VICPICKKDIEVIRAENDYRDDLSGKTYSIFQCKECECHFAEPMCQPGPEWYAKYTKIFGYGNSSAGKPNWRTKLLQHVKLSPLKKMRLLDIGCGAGEFIEQAKILGFDVYGLDFDKTKIALANQKGLTQAFACSAEDFFANSNSQLYDVITFFQVIEHLQDPATFLESVKKLLVAGGYVLLDVPNRKTVFNKAMGAIDYPPHHLSRWTTGTVQKFLIAGGFKIEYLGTVLTARIFYYSLVCTLSLKLSRTLHSLRRKNNVQIKTQPTEGLPIQRWKVYIPLIQASVVVILASFSWFLVYPLLWALRATGKGAHIVALARISETPKGDNTIG
jgi:2-polyprenyl-3-methyl-5-hydroxy-6-metoxy-1,4-benzoquinol methylase